MVVYSYMFDLAGPRFDSGQFHMTNTVYVREGLDIQRIKEEYEFLGYQVKRDGQNLLLSMKGTKKRDKKPSARDSRGGSSDSKSDDRAERGRTTGRERRDGSRDTRRS